MQSIIGYSQRKFSELENLEDLINNFKGHQDIEEILIGASKFINLTDKRELNYYFQKLMRFYEFSSVFQ